MQVSDDEGATWHHLSSAHMKLGSAASGSRQKAGTFDFDGNVHEWTFQECSLDRFTGRNLWLRFGMLSDGRGEFDGLYLRDITLRTYRNSAEQSAIFQRNDLTMSIAPNPVYGAPEFTITVPPNAELQNARVDIFNTVGQRIYSKSIREIPQYRDRLIISVPAFFTGMHTVVLNTVNARASANVVFVR